MLAEHAGSPDRSEHPDSARSAERSPRGDRPTPMQDPRRRCGFHPNPACLWRIAGAASARQTMAAPLGRLGSLEVRLARKAGEIRRAQNFATTSSTRTDRPSPTPPPCWRGAMSMGSTASATIFSSSIMPPRCSVPLKKPPVVGTYRLLPQDMAERHGGSYTANEFDIGGLLAQHSSLRFLELGRSCVLPRYRNKRTVELLWHGIYAYVVQNGVNVMIGCASLDGTDPDALALPLSFLHHYAAAPEQWRATALPQRYVEMNRMPKETIDPKAALRAAAVDQGLSAARRRDRPGRCGGPAIRHHRRADHPAGVRDHHAPRHFDQPAARRKSGEHCHRRGLNPSPLLEIFG